MSFDPQRVLPPTVLGELIRSRAIDPERALRASRRRRRRGRLSESGALCLLRADLPARGVLHGGTDPRAMGDRWELLARVLSALEAPGVDGLIATADLIEELLIIDDVEREAGMAALLDDKVILLSLNRGGLSGSAWELDDAWTGGSASAASELGLDGGKVCVRLHLAEKNTLDTMRVCSAAVSDFSRAKLPIIVETLPVKRTKHGWTVDRQSAQLVWAVSIAQSLGEVARFTWLNVPTCHGFEEVARATTLPVAVTPVGSTVEELEADLLASLRSGPNVSAAILGPEVLFPGTDKEPKASAASLARWVHRAEV